MPDWIWLLMSGLVGAVLGALVPLLLLVWYTRPAASSKEQDPCFLPPTLSQELLDELTRGAGGTPEGVLNAALQFIFQQSTADTRWLRRRMAAELAELLTKTSSGRLFESLTLRSLEVGSEFPSLSNLRLLSGELEEGSSRLRSLDLRLDLAYNGNFRIDVDAVMLLGKIANISITLESVQGRVRVLFRRTPYTHWACAFEAPPRLELRVCGRFQGRQLKPRLAAMVAAHIRRAIATRHTLPNYKIRYKPFFPKSEPGSGWGEGEGPAPSGRLRVRLLEVTRLQNPMPATASAHTQPPTVRASLAVHSHAWVSLNNDILVVDVTFSSSGAGPLGLVCCQGVGAVLVDTVVPMSLAYRADLRRGDVVLAIDSKPLTHVAQVSKLLRQAERRSVTIRIKRSIARVKRRERLDSSASSQDVNSLAPEPRKSKTNFSFRRVSEVMEGVRLQGMRAARGNSQETDQSAKCEAQQENEAQSLKIDSTKTTSKPVDPTGNFGLRKRRCSVENKSSDSSANSTPNTSGANTPLKTAKDAKPKQEIPTIRTELSENNKRERDTESNMADDVDSSPKHSEHVEICQMFWTKSSELKQIISFDEENEFKLNENHKYLNINVWASQGENEVLLGYLNIPLGSLLSECVDSTIPHHMKRYQFLPPDVDIKFSKCHKLSSHAGFEPCLCFGDVLLWWQWEAGGGRAGPAPRTAPAPAPCTPLPAPHATHDFLRTHFHRSTQCDFCNKKIWLKDAMQCRRCGLCCHKKCVLKCQETSPCHPQHDDTAADLMNGSSHVSGLGGKCSPPELITTDVDADCDGDSDDELPRKNSLDPHDEGSGGMGGMSALMAGLRRAGSAQALCAPRPHSAHARSLPPSPSHTPRKQSLEGGGCNPFAGCGAAWDRGERVSRLLRPIVQARMDPEQLLAAARDHAPLLAQRLSIDQIYDMLSAVREELYAEDKGSGEGDVEERTGALTALMLHCCAAAQVSQQNLDLATQATEHEDIPAEPKT